MDNIDFSYKKLPDNTITECNIQCDATKFVLACNAFLVGVPV